MKLVKVKSFFKLGAKQKRENAEAVKRGDKILPHVKKADMNWEFNGFETAEDCVLAVNTSTPAVVDALNFVLETFGKSLVDSEGFPENSVNKVTLLNWHVAYTADVTRTRAVTAKTLDAFGNFYFKYAQELLSKPAAACAAGSQVIKNKLVGIIGNAEACKRMSDNLVSLAAAIDELDDEAISAEFDKHSAVVEFLLKELAPVETVTAESL